MFSCVGLFNQCYRILSFTNAKNVFFLYQHHKCQSLHQSHKFLINATDVDFQVDVFIGSSSLSSATKSSISQWKRARQILVVCAVDLVSFAILPAFFIHHLISLELNPNRRSFFFFSTLFF